MINMSIFNNTVVLDDLSPSIPSMRMQREGGQVRKEGVRG
jgi:hypothetical protein